MRHCWSGVLNRSFLDTSIPVSCDRATNLSIGLAQTHRTGVVCGAMTEAKGQLPHRSTLPVVFGRGLKRWREANNLSQEDVARRLARTGLHWNRSQVAKLERGERSLTLEQAVAVAAALDEPLTGFITDDAPTIVEILPNYARSEEHTSELQSRLHLV